MPSVSSVGFVLVGAVVPMLLLGFQYQEMLSLQARNAELNRLVHLIERNASDAEAIVIKPLRTYSPLHREKEEWLRKWLDEYIDFHGQVTRGEVQQRYAKCSLAHGYGNCWQQFVSCALYAMMSKRALLLVRRSWDPGNPFMNRFEEFYEPAPVKLFNSNASMMNEPIYGPEEKKWQNFGGTLATASGCYNLEEYLSTIPYLGLSGSDGFDYFADHLRDNPNHELLHKLPSNFYQIIFDFWVKLKPEFRAEIDRFKREKFGKYTIGLQMRGNDAGGVHAMMPLEIFLQAGELLAADAPVPYEDVVFFVASPDADAVHAAQKVWGDKKVIYYEGSQERGTLMGNTVGMLTMWLFGECDDVVTSEGSSYGTNSAARTGLIPVVCNQNRVCMRRLTPQPCSYTPYPAQKDDCVQNKSKTFKTFSSIEAHCGYFFRSNRDCLDFGCRDDYNSFTPHHPLPPWPKQPEGCNETFYHGRTVTCLQHCASCVEN
eukprot:TRINITY_DN2980_c0_g1_i1.p1 TRINITY_DN2980_c0_g1~~TRINITY_DN2980_c0_g1_i1.p1  ORF type:complete len:487 (-),score=137.56 TRINITY_DN2980_c0_g1_i1:89-1549(-)